MNQDTNREDRVEHTQPADDGVAAFSFDVMAALIDRQCAATFAVTPRMQGRSICGSCGAATDPYGNLPCGH
ncbi:hypothetical protein LFL96_21090 [Paraburkholderia sp. D15]|uniref:hypothetical protein n=1 Tax=Paraburkholderia sp. D15 TaxID=2880218 RepID=UPI00247A6870|nr:hypothetical protein [Paraburkholderia sp. D15]WGS53557.1 hypothetical protein LFL96_21090 [Paraburkholderia sp. D15]